MALFFDTLLTDGGWQRDVRLVIEAGRIARMETGACAAGDERHAIGIPGLGNVHSHAFQRGMAGLAERRGEHDDDSFWTWRETMYRFVDRIGPDELRAIAGLAYMEMLEAGFTRVGEFHYLHHDLDGGRYGNPAEMAVAIADAADTSGIGLTLLPVFYAHAGFGGQPPGPGQRRFVHDVDGFGRLVEASRAAVAPLGDAVVGIAPHSLRAIMPRELTAILPFAGGGPVHIHVAEQAREVADCLVWCGARPVEWLLDNAPVDERWCLVHATHLAGDEVARLAASGSVAVLCPITEANLGDGVFPAAVFLGAGGRFGIGTDSNVLIDAAEELRLLEYGQRLVAQRRNVLADAARLSTGARLFAGALAGSAQALGVAGSAQALGVAGGIAVGASADIVALDGDHPALVAREGDRILDSWIFAARGSCVDTVWRRGRKLVSGGRHHDAAAITARYRAVMTRLLA
jgi:formimidoylglutamate deiminase